MTNSDGLTKQNVFELIGEAKSRGLLRDASRLRLDALVTKDDNSLSFRLVGAGYIDAAIFLIASGKVVTDEGQYLLSVIIENEKYFVKAQCVLNGGKLRVLEPYNLYRLRRRSYVRIDIDGMVDAHFVISQHKEQPLINTAEIIDISAGGMRVVLSNVTNTFNIGDIIAGELKLSYRANIAVQFEVRLVLVDKNTNRITLGGRFLALVPPTEVRLFKTVMNLAQEINAEKRKRSLSIKKKI